MVVLSKFLLWLLLWPLFLGLRNSWWTLLLIGGWWVLIATVLISLLGSLLI